MTSTSSPTCIICHESSHPMQKVHCKGFLALLNFSKENNQVQLHDRLVEMQKSKEQVYVHRCCRNQWFFKRGSNSDSVGEASEPKRLRSQSEESSFDWKKSCFICGNHVDRRLWIKNQKKEVFKVRTLPSVKIT